MATKKPKTARKPPAKNGNRKASRGFTAEERSAMRERVRDEVVLAALEERGVSRGLVALTARHPGGDPREGAQHGGVGGQEERATTLSGPRGKLVAPGVQLVRDG